MSIGNERAVPGSESPSEATPEGDGEATARDAASAELAADTEADAGAEIGLTITAMLEDGPLEDSSIETELVEGRPPKTIDAPADDGSTCRYCLAGWVQSGRSAAYTFLYRV